MDAAGRANLRATVEEAILELERGLGCYENPRREAEILLAHVLGLRRGELRAHLHHEMPAQALAALADLVTALPPGMPSALHVGYIDLAGDMRLRLTNDVLVPGPEGELLTATVCDLIEEFALGTGTVVDVGTGSGMAAVTVARRYPGVRMVAIDISRAALTVAMMNAADNGVQVRFLHGDLLEPLGVDAKQQADLIVANLPYVRSSEVPLLRPQFSRYAPRTALDGGADGLELYRRFLPAAEYVLKCGGFLVLENDVGQSTRLSRLCQQASLRIQKTVRNQRGEERVLVAVRSDEPMRHEQST